MFTEDSLRVCMKGTDRTGDISGSSTRVSRFELVAVSAWLLRSSRSSDLLRLCLEVRLSSRGFMSGGSFEIFRNKTAR